MGKFMDETGVAKLWERICGKIDADLSGVADQIAAEIGARAKITTGSYFGTGKYGSENKNTLSFDFVPRLLLISNGHPTGDFFSGNYNFARSPFSFGACIDWQATIDTVNGSYENKGGFSAHYNGTTADCYTTFSNDNKTISWYSTSDQYGQLNSSETQYYYIAIG